MTVHAIAVSTVTVESPAQLYDRCTRRTALLGFSDRDKTPEDRNEMEDQNKIRFGAEASGGPILYWATSGGRYTVLDLSRVTDPLRHLRYPATGLQPHGFGSEPGSRAEDRHGDHTSMDHHDGPRLPAQPRLSRALIGPRAK
ncbi:hypothetical protein DKM19_43895 [Streptosporangium sp. 'caverna']|nr:hypothetical protein DKM19_43895 [Streptosporangium sp. 'caverna']